MEGPQRAVPQMEVPQRAARGIPQKGLPQMEEPQRAARRAPREGAAREDAAIKGSADTSGEAIDGKISGNTAGTFDSDSRASEDIVAGSPGRVGTGSAIGSELVGTAFEGRTFDAGNPSDGNARLATLAGRLGIETGGKAMEDCTKVCKLIDGKDTGRRPESTDSTTGTTLGIIELAGDI
ncbi:hypothetical protein HBI27_246270 [Parastagonospora nodorum]|nr:hypothetical protein HBI27_246270 [Parastagonospora nodorum]